ncbi:MAG: tRNA preQ1(34) S-adenosylmethionine ribosyltransferase-isomerase QueA [Dehalococcoidia bacterium]|nr:tRNA preQ1(34) S-adenosylmethionine ribosyltransferase-isomerase QueA [Dehalococcoidia bacterium]
MRTSDFDYHLPQHLIAQTPAEPRDSSRLLVLDRATGAVAHRPRFSELVELLRPGDLLVMNDSRVLPARLYGALQPDISPSLQGKGPGVRLVLSAAKDLPPSPMEEGQGVRSVELLLLRRVAPARWLCLARPAKRLTPGARLLLSRDGASVEALVEEAQDGGLRTIRFSDEAALERVGHTPLPPYIKAPTADPERYQTVYARVPGSAAAPTAGLHFTPELLARLRSLGVQTASVTLHVGLDTFRPVQEDDPGRHRIHTEYWELGAEAADALNRAREERRRIVAVGTTSVRVLEQAARLAVPASRPDESDWRFTPASGWADLFILPGHRFRAVDALLTNFHLPRSTLLMLVCAFAGRDPVLRAYHEAIAQGYRFYSFGDAMLIS